MATNSELTAQLNRLAGTTPTTRLEAVGAANLWAQTTGLGLLAALNAKTNLAHPTAVSGGKCLDLNGICNALAGTSGLEAIDALSRM